MRRVAGRLLVVAWLLGALATWNVVFDNHVGRGADDYLDRQEAFAAGRGARADMDAMMRAAVRSGAWAATGWTLLWLAPLGVVLAVRRRTPSTSGR